jgi:hypothetical protein
VLADDGTLSYYNTKEDMGQGCKGSMMVSACEIIGKTPKKHTHGSPLSNGGDFCRKKSILEWSMLNRCRLSFFQ